MPSAQRCLLALTGVGFQLLVCPVFKLALTWDETTTTTCNGPVLLFVHLVEAVQNKIKKKAGKWESGKAGAVEL